MPKNWKEALEAQEDIEVDIGGTKLKLSELRTMRNEEIASIKRQAEADVARADETLAALLSAAPPPEKKEEKTAVQAAGFDIPETDLVLGPLVKKLNAAEATSAQVIAALKRLEQSTNANIAANIELTYREAFNRNKDNYPGVDSYEAARDYAAKNRIVNARGIIDPLEAAERMSSGTRHQREIAAREAAARADERTKVMAELESRAGALAFTAPGVTPPGRPEGAFKPDKKASLKENLTNAIRQGLPKALQAGRA